jgi:hypothetical protein
VRVSIRPGSNASWALFLVVILPAVGRAQFNYTTQNGGVTITGYTGPGGAVVIPATINSLPVTSIGDSAFDFATNVTSVTMPDSITNIAEYAFYDCLALAAVTIPNSVISIGGSAFAYCDSLTVAAIPTNVTSIADYAFFSCGSLTNVAIPGGVTSIGDSAFAYCGSLGSVMIPGSVTNIVEYAFYSCGGLSGVYFGGNASAPGSSVFTSDARATVYYLPGTSGWASTFGGRPTALWVPQVQNNGASFGVRTNRFGFNILWASGETVVVEACTNPANPVWSRIQTNTISGGSAYFSDAKWTNFPGRFYRVVSP